jgi:hypothetical protein
VSRPIEAILKTQVNEISDENWGDYRALVAMNPSTIAHGETSMLHLLNAWQTPGKDTDALSWGRAVHTLCLEPHEFKKRYDYWVGRRGGNEWKEFAAEAADNGIEVLKQDAYESAIEAGKRCAEQPKVVQAVGTGQAEVTVLATEFGMQCKGRLDWVRSDQGIVDLKTTRNISSRAFGRDFYKFHYDLKLGLYQRWLSRLRGQAEPVTVVCIENVKPYDVTVVPIPDAVLERGADKGLAILDELRQCIETNDFPGVDGGADTYELFVPPWEMDEADDYDDYPKREQANAGT